MSKPKHHIRQQVCGTRAPYREGRKPKAVKVYTVNQESKYLVIQGVPGVGAVHELVRLFEEHGTIEEHRLLDDYPSEQFTDVHLIKFEKIMSARQAKRKRDDWSFYGGVLHICYAPEYESVQETREKLKDRRMAIAAKVRQYSQDGTYSSSGQGSASSGEKNLSTNLASLPGISHKSIAPVSTQGSSNVDESHTYNTKGHTRYTEGHTHYTEGNVHYPNSHTHHHTEGHSHVLSLGNIQENSQFHSSITNYNQFRNASSHSGIDTQNRNTQQLNQQGLSSFATKNEQMGPYLSQHNNSSHIHNNSYARDASLSNTQQDSNEQHFRLPLPPRQTSGRPHLHIPRQRGPQGLHNYEYANVRSAQSGFPADFDARLGSEASKGSGQETESAEESNETENAQEEEESVVELDYTPKSIHEKIEENIKNKNVVIKTFQKKGPAPMFIPRQAMKKKTLTKSAAETAKSKSEKGDKAGEGEVNARLKRDAFTLKDVQGPAQIMDRPEVDQKEVSVQKSVREIRKHLNQISTVQGPPAKKMKPAES